MYEGIIKRKIIVKSENIEDTELYIFFKKISLSFVPQEGMFIRFFLQELCIDTVSFNEENDFQSPSLSIELKAFEIPVEDKETLNQQLKIMTQCGFDYTLI